MVITQFWNLIDVVVYLNSEARKDAPRYIVDYRCVVAVLFLSYTRTSKHSLRASWIELIMCF